MKKNKLNILIKIISIIMTVLVIAFVIYGIQLGIFSSNKELVIYIKSFGIIAPLIFILIQIIQVIFPVVPGGASCLAGTLAFGSLQGFIYNYVGLCLGSCVVFFLSRMYGYPLIKKLFKEETVSKYMKHIRSEKFNKIFFWVILIPGLPDDLLCYLAGLSSMKFKDFLIIILIGKPLSLIGYSFFTYFFPLIFK